MAITENNMIDHEGKIHAQKQPEKMIPEILVVDDEEVNRTLLDMIFPGIIMSCRRRAEKMHRNTGTAGQ